MSGGNRLRGLAFTRQFPNRAEPFRGIFVLEQLLATQDVVDWEVIAPIPWVPKALASRVRHPRIPERDQIEGLTVTRPRYWVLPRRQLYTTVAASMARAAAPAFRALCKREDPPQFVHAHELYPSAAAACRLAVPSGVPLILTVHGSDLYSNLENRRWRGELASAVNCASAVLCVSRALARDVAAEFGDTVPVQVLPDTFDAHKFRYMERPPHAGPLRFLSVGRLSAEKGYDVLLRALARVTEDGLDATLRIVGGGPELSRLTELSRALHVTERVTFLGAGTRETVAAECARADGYVQPSLREGFGVALLEALATGLPAVASDAGGPADMITGSNGVLVLPGDADSLAAGLMRLANHIASNAVDPAAIAADALARFGPVPVAARLEAVYAAVAGNLA